MQVVWTAAALRDLAAIKEYLTADNPAAASRQIRLVLEAINSLLSFPHIGRQGRVEGTRELIVSHTPYLVPYRILGDLIEIARILHARQRWPTRL